MDTKSFIVNKTLEYLLLIFFLLFMLWLVVGYKGKTVQTKRTSSDSTQAANIVDQIRKNSKGTLSIVGINSITGAVVSQRELSFDEAVKLVGNVTDVCVGRYNVGSAYEQCAKLRRY